MKSISKSKLGIIIILITFAAAITAGCSKPGKQVVKTPDLALIEESVMKDFDLTDTMKLDDKKLERVYKIKPEEVEGYFVYISTSVIKADEIAVFKTKDAAGADYIKKMIEDRMVQLGTSFKDYLPEQYSLIEKYTVEVKGNYVFLVVSKDGEKFKASFDKCFE